MKQPLLIFLLVLTSLTLSCSKKVKVEEVKYTLEEFDKLAEAASPIKDKAQDGFNLADYAPGVNRLESKALVFNRLTFFAVEFETETQARSEALRLNQYYARNWLFDRVEGEPVLEDYVIETFKAINPKRNVQRVPKKHAPEHGAEHGETHGEHKEEHH